jgi:hypothetical protein
VQLLECRHSRSKSLKLFNDNVKTLDFLSRELKGNNHVIHIDFDCEFNQDHHDAWFAETICDLPLVTSIQVSGTQRTQRLPPIQRHTPLFIDDHPSSQSLGTFLNNDQSLARTRDTYVFMQHTDNCNIAVSFIGPSSGDLTLRLKHCARLPDTTLTVLGTSFTLTIPESPTIDDINLYPIGDSPSQLSFAPNIRNNLILQTSKLKYFLQDLQLLDEDGHLYGQPSQRDIPATEFDAHSMPDDRESWDFNFESDAVRTADDSESRDSEPEQELPSSGHDDLVAHANLGAAAGYDVNLIE